MQVLDGTASCHDQQVFNNTVVYLGIKKPGGGKDDFETLAEIAPNQTFEYEYSGHVRKREEKAATAEHD